MTSSSAETQTQPSGLYDTGLSGETQPQSPHTPIASEQSPHTPIASKQSPPPPLARQRTCTLILSPFEQTDPTSPPTLTSSLTVVPVVSEVSEVPVVPRVPPARMFAEYIQRNMMDILLNVDACAQSYDAINHFASCLYIESIRTVSPEQCKGIAWTLFEHIGQNVSSMTEKSNATLAYAQCILSQTLDFDVERKAFAMKLLRNVAIVMKLVKTTSDILSAMELMYSSLLSALKKVVSTSESSAATVHAQLCEQAERESVAARSAFAIELEEFVYSVQYATENITTLMDHIELSFATTPDHDAYM